jgi:aryl-alcohol dehydrogenase-like predicted oxidoreductase
MSRIAAAYGDASTPTQMALSCLVHRAANILPIPGTMSIAHLEENVAAAKLDLTRDQLQQLASDSVREGVSQQRRARALEQPPRA